MAELEFETTDVEVARALEQQLPPGLHEARISLLRPLSQEEMDNLHNALLEGGVDVKGIIPLRVKGLWQVAIKYRIHSPSEHIAQWQLLVPLIPLAVIAVVVGIALFKINQITTLILVAGGVAILLAFLLRKPIESYAARH